MPSNPILIQQLLDALDALSGIQSTPDFGRPMPRG